MLLNNLRNRAASRTCNFILNHVATKPYRDFIAGAISYGMNSAARDEKYNASPPTDWMTTK